MDLNYSQEESAFRDEVRGWLKDNLPQDLREKIANYDELSRDDLLRWHKILAKKGWVAPSWPKEFGGTSWNVVQRYIFEEECGYAGCPPLVPFGLHMCAPVLLRFGTDAQKKRFLPRIYQGEDFWCQGYSEPGSGSDLASLKTRAVRQGDHYVVTGEKTFITSGMRADFLTVAVRTDPANKGPGGVSLLVIDGDTPGLTRSELKKMGWWSSDTAHLHFDGCRVPRANLLGAPGEGLALLLASLNRSRPSVAAHALGIARAAFEDAVAYINERRQSGRRIVEFQGIQFLLADLATELAQCEAWLWHVARLVDGGAQDFGIEASMLKMRASDLAMRIATEAVQLHGGYGYCKDYRVERLMRDAKITQIWEGTNQVHRQLIGRSFIAKR